MITDKAAKIYLVEGVGQIKELDGLEYLKQGNLVKLYDMDYSILTNDRGEYIFRVATIEHGDIEWEPEAYKNKDLPALFKGDI